jgi:hypothetical protein
MVQLVKSSIDALETVTSLRNFASSLASFAVSADSLTAKDAKNRKDWPLAQSGAVQLRTENRQKCELM